MQDPVRVHQRELLIERAGEGSGGWIFADWGCQAVDSEPCGGKNRVSRLGVGGLRYPATDGASVSYSVIMWNLMFIKIETLSLRRLYWRIIGGNEKSHYNLSYRDIILPWDDILISKVKLKKRINIEKYCCIYIQFLMGESFFTPRTPEISTGA